MKKLNILIIIVMMFSLVSFVYASDTSTVESSYIFKRGDNIDLKVSCIDTDNSLCAVQIPCYITVISPNTTTIINGAYMTHNENYYNYTLSGDKTQQLGNYANTVFCSGGSNGFSSFNFEVTATGHNPSVAEGIINGIMILIPLLLSFIFLIGAWITDVDEHRLLKLFLFLASIVPFFTTMHFGLINIAKFYGSSEVQDLIGGTTYWVGIIFFVILTYFMIYIFYTAVHVAAQKKKARLEY